MLSDLSKYKFILIVILAVLAVYNFSNTLMEVYKSSIRLNEVQKEVVLKRLENEALNKDLSYKNSPEFIESEARNKLNLSKPGEKVVIPVGFVLGLTDKGAVVKSFGNNVDSNLKKWVELLF